MCEDYKDDDEEYDDFGENYNDDMIKNMLSLGAFLIKVALIILVGITYFNTIKNDIITPVKTNIYVTIDSIRYVKGTTEMIYLPEYDKTFKCINPPKFYVNIIDDNKHITINDEKTYNLAMTKVGKRCKAIKISTKLNSHESYPDKYILLK